MLRLAINGRFYAGRPTGVQRVARELTDRLCDRAEVTLLVPRGVEPPAAVAARARVVPGRLAGRIWEQAELPWMSTRVGSDLALDPANAAPASGGPRVLLLHDVAPLTNPEWFRPAFRAWYSATTARAARRAIRVVTFTEWARSEAARALALAPDRITVIGQGVEPFSESATPDRVDRVSRRLDLPPRYLLAGGWGDPRKDVEFLFEVLRAWPRSDGPPPPLLVFGAPYDRIHAVEWRQAHDGAAVRVLGHVTDEELHVLYTCAAAFCFPSRAEGFGRPPVEAMACGAPVVAADYGSAREVLGGAAVVLPKHPATWVRALAGLVSPGPERDRRIAAGFARAAAFRWDGAADRLVAVCREANGGGGR